MNTDNLAGLTTSQLLDFYNVWYNMFNAAIDTVLASGKLPQVETTYELCDCPNKGLDCNNACKLSIMCLRHNAGGEFALLVRSATSDQWLLHANRVCTHLRRCIADIEHTAHTVDLLPLEEIENKHIHSIAAIPDTRHKDAAEITFLDGTSLSIYAYQHQGEARLRMVYNS